MSPRLAAATMAALGYDPAKFGVAIDPKGFRPGILVLRPSGEPLKHFPNVVLERKRKAPQFRLAVRAAMAGGRV